MLVTSLCWLLYDGDGFEMLANFHYVGDFLNVLNRSPTSQTCHQHVWSPTSVTNIDLTATDINMKSRIVKMVTDYDTSHELRAAEIRNLQNSFEEEISMVSLFSQNTIQT